MYAHITLTTLVVIGTPSPLPAYLTGLDQAHLADLSWCDGYPDLAGTGYWPVSDDDSAITAGLVASEEDSFTPDATTKTVTRHLGARAMTAGELATAKTAALASLAATRYGHETGGATVNGVAVKTDRDSQALINGAYALVNAGAVQTVQFKAAPGQFVSLTAAQMQAIGLAVGQHVQACFAHEAALSVQINAVADGVALAGIDLTAGWPASAGS